MDSVKIGDDLMSAEAALHTARMMSDDQFSAVFKCSKYDMFRNVAAVLIRMADRKKKEA